jgi:transposase
MTINFGNATVQRLQSERKIAERLNNLRLYKISECLLLIHQGRSFHTIADWLHISLRTVYHWLSHFLLRRFAWLCGHHYQGRGRKPKLNPQQKEQLYTIIENGPIAYGFECGIWTSSMIVLVIEREFHVTYNPRYVCTLLHQMGITYQKATFVSDKRDDDEHQKKRKKWEMETWPAILQQARDLGAVILFGDEVSFAQWGSLFRTWAPKAKQPQVRTCGKRKGLKMFGVIEVRQGDFIYMECEDKFTNVSYQTFLDKIVTHYSCPIILIEDGASYHNGPDLKAFETDMEAQGRLFVYRLPAYSPDKNPIEKLWKNTKRDATHCRYFPTFESLREAVVHAFEQYLLDASKVICVMKKLRAQAGIA